MLEGVPSISSFQGMDPDYALHYRELYEKHWWWRAREAVIVDVVAKLRSGKKRQRILDVGCGDGLFFDRLSPFGDVEGVEPDPTTLAANGRHRHAIHVGAFDATFAPHSRYSLILMLDVLEHLPDPTTALRHAVSLLSADGRVVITVPAFQQLWTSHDVLNHHYRRYTKRSFAEVAQAAGLMIEDQWYFFYWLFPLKLGVRMLEYVGQSEPTTPRIPTTWLNRTLFRLSRFEQRIAPARWMPFGSSLLVVGRKDTGDG